MSIVQRTQETKMNSTMKVWLLAVIVVLTIFTNNISTAGQTFEFSWAVLADTPHGQKPVDFTQQTPLGDGTTLQIFLEQKPGVFIYVYLVDSNGALELIFPEVLELYNSTVPADRIIRIPPGASRFEFTPPPGQEKLYIMASIRRLLKLEQLTEKYLQQPGDRKNRAAVLQEMKKIRRQNSKLTQTTETSVPVAGTVRSGKQGRETFRVTRVKAENFYSRILRISHE